MCDCGQNPLGDELLDIVWTDFKLARGDKSCS